MKKLFLLLLLAFPADAAEQSIAKELYIEDTKDKIAAIMGKQARGEFSEYDQFMLDRLTSRVTEVAQVGSRVVFTNAVENREPKEVLQSATKDCGQIILFTEIMNQNGKTVQHVWYADGVEVYTQAFNVKADRWRVWSAKSIQQAERITVLIYADDELIAATGINVL